MRVKTVIDLLLIGLATVALLVAVALTPSNPLRIVLGIPFLLFFPGYCLVAALFPRKSSIDAIERVGLSFMMSIAIVPLIGLALNYTPIGIRLEPVLYSVAAFIFASSVVAWFRRGALTEHDRFEIVLNWKMKMTQGKTLDRVLSLLLVLAIVGALGVLGYVLANPKTGEKFSEFYILGSNGRAADYPQDIRKGETARVIVGIVNHEQAASSYRVQININGVNYTQVGPVSLDNEQKWESVVSFTPKEVGSDQKVEFLLFRNNDTEPCLQPLHLWISVRD